MTANVIEAGGYTLRVRCVAGIESCCYVDSIDVAFDLGFIIDRVVSKSHIFITHGHVDHIGAVVMHAARRALQKLMPAQYYMPAHLVPHLESILQSTAAMQGGEPFPARLVPLQPFDEIQISPKWLVRAVPTTHRVPSLGYVLYERKNRLKPEYKLLAGKDIAALKRAGYEITGVELTPEIAYTGDTMIEAFTEAEERAKDLLRVKVLITEATYVDDKMTVEDAKARGHTHLDQIAAHENLFRHVGTLVLVHFSARYSPEYLSESVRSRFPPSLLNKTVLG
ncbi:hypothetical protein BBO99_00004479 [Phytophthora kernoviae]|uniref:Metallo-beta-lactamase domain-containing protein n=2 Tax=Phytophthora kernoviae TaxID=325452 RepID=A0A3R7GXI1_9STRA|nr:hypothetical protein G195_004504 [Phytophthora kernoviae 00238/432]KAG2525770.1 hypothetical protein JM16_004234 [Phytophthora kernoviae]KAG2527551.1 hypothetical protein JM18_003756 [Phytophthora kernoviae]RLN14090.1 hypothetical protein BBI17_004578 [Phytophthora kernoviae]RLN80447.1 hypothetical protein BBO99_00004479 [Phytophthora kernoviae]